MAGRNFYACFAFKFALNIDTMDTVTLTKEQIHNACLEEVNGRIERLKTDLKEAQEAANEDSKSSMGDKYETGRAMAHLETEKYAGQLSTAREMKAVLEGFNPHKHREEASAGSLVRTSQGLFYLSVSLGQMKINGETVFAVSPVSPIGQVMQEKKTGDHFELNGRSYSIIKVS